MKLTLRVQKHETYQLWLSSIKKKLSPVDTSLSQNKPHYIRHARRLT